MRAKEPNLNKTKLSATTGITLIFYAYVFILLIHNSFSYLDPDLGWHLKVGESITQSGQVPHINTSSYPLFGANWVDHEWLANAVMYFIYTHAGYGLLTLIFALIILLALFLQNIFLTRLILPPKNGTLLIIFFQMFGIVASAGHWGIRIQEVSFLFLLILLIILHLFRRKGAWQILLWIPPLFFLWSTLHASFIMGLFVLAFWIAVHLCTGIIRRTTKGQLKTWKIMPMQGLRRYIYFPPASNKSLAQASAIFLASLAATLVTPYGLNLYSFLLGYKNTYYMRHIQEWHSIFDSPVQYLQMAYISFLPAMIMFSVLYHTLKQKSAKYITFDFWYLLLALVFFFAAVQSKRNFPLFFAVSLPLFVPFFASLLDLPDSLLNNDRSRLFKSIKWAGLVIVSAMIALRLAQTRFTNEPFRHYCNEYPCGAVTFLKNNPQLIGMRMLNAYTWGGYLIWTMPEQQLFIDGRFPQMEFKEHTILEEYGLFFEESTVKQKIAEHDIQIFLLYSQNKKKRLGWLERHLFHRNNLDKNNKEYISSPPTLNDHLNSRTDFHKIYEDATAVIYAKK